MGLDEKVAVEDQQCSCGGSMSKLAFEKTGFIISDPAGDIEALLAT